MSSRFLTLALVLVLSFGLAAAAVWYMQSGGVNGQVEMPPEENLAGTPLPGLGDDADLPSDSEVAEEESADESAQADTTELTEDENAAAGADAPSDEEQAEEEAEPEPPKPVVSENAKAHLCYLSFNNPYEVSVARNFANKLTRYPAAPKITVTEYQAEDADPEDAIEALVRSGVRCDGLVLSGHHDEDGEFWGDRTSGDLEIDFLYSLSSRPGYSAWFSQVKALWLQGCHTATTEVFNKDVDDDERIGSSPLHMIRKHLNLGELEDSIDDLNDIFLENTNEDNIILDYARIFPSATVFTWWDKSPGIKAGSHFSLPFHIVQTAYVIDPDPRYFVNPTGKTITEDASLRYAEILYEMMTRPMYPYKHPGPLQGDEKLFIEGWRQHGRWAIHKRKYSFENASTIGYPSLLSSQSGVLKQTRGFTNLLTQLEEERIGHNAGAVVSYVLGAEELIPYNVYTLWVIAERSEDLKAKIRASTALKQHLEEIFNAPDEDSALKRDYRKFHSWLYG